MSHNFPFIAVPEFEFGQGAIRDATARNPITMTAIHLGRVVKTMGRWRVVGAAKGSDGYDTPEGAAMELYRGLFPQEFAAALQLEVSLESQIAELAAEVAAAAPAPAQPFKGGGSGDDVALSKPGSAGYYVVRQDKRCRQLYGAFRLEGPARNFGKLIGWPEVQYFTAAELLELKDLPKTWISHPQHARKFFLPGPGGEKPTWSEVQNSL